MVKRRSQSQQTSWKVKLVRGDFRFRRSNIKKTEIKKRRGGQENE